MRFTKPIYILGVVAVVIIEPCDDLGSEPGEMDQM